MSDDNQYFRDDRRNPLGILLATRAASGEGPQYILGRPVLYPEVALEVALEDWIAKRTINPEKREQKPKTSGRRFG